MIFDYPTPAALAAHVDEQLSSVTIVTDAPSSEPDRLARFNDIARELQTLVNQPEWTPDDKTHLSARIKTILTGLTAPAPSQTQPVDGGDDIATASESELFAILDEDAGP